MEESRECKVPAAILAIGTANPSNCINQEDYPDFLFGVTNTQHLTNAREKFIRICEKYAIKKRYFHLNEEILKQNPALCSYAAASLNPRQDLAIDLNPKLGMEAAVKSIEEWGQPKSTITHLIFCCYAGGTVLRIAKDIAENNPGARVLAVCSESTIVSFRAPSEDDPVYLISNALFSDGAAAMIIGTVPPNATIERPIFRIIFASQSAVPDSDWAIEGHHREASLTMRISEKVPDLIATDLKEILVEAFSSTTVTDWNSIFWAPHPGGKKILDYIEARFGLGKEKLKAARQVLEEFGNMVSASVFFMLDEIRKRSIEEGKATTGEGMELGVLLGFGPGLTVETVVLQSVPIVGG
ncbi:hypothetical protein BT93_L0990 [Corymbia citriodora subsp. variegata]|uniref:Chalcone synthase n=1 Tax=Corymbia citriodora subsp. variegata TaxID=360336 RepID=A0A8T0CNU7_CORYI|nr:hypothetical protein BT93_L0990 [Corymbia citriodora subsp. variegata]